MPAMLAEVCLDEEADLVLLRCNIAANNMGQVMFDGIDARLEEGVVDRRVGGWDIVASAWALVLMLMVLLAGIGVLACLRSASQPDRPFAGAVIPQHDPCVELGLASAPGPDGCDSIPLKPDMSTWSNYW
jgi:hypothetical protein